MKDAARGRPRAERSDQHSIKGELFGSTRLASHARRLARRHSLAPATAPGWRSRGDRGPLLRHLEATEAALIRARATLMRASAASEDVGPAGAWLLDNFFIVAEQIPEVRATLPAGYYHKLPKLAGDGPRAGYPRIYDIVVELIAHTDGRLDEASLGTMIGQYQTVQPLTMGELWAIPAMLRLGCLENVRRMALRAAHNVTDREDADAWAARLMGAASKGDASGGLWDFVHSGPRLTPAFLTRFLQQIRSRRSDFTPLLWVEQWVAEDVMSVQEAAQLSLQELALTQLVMSNSIASLRYIGSVDWMAFVERESATEAVLREDPSEAYAAMTRETRDLYRHAVERIARGAGLEEPAVARAAIDASRAASPVDPRARERHVGYHLVGAGCRAFEHLCGVRPTGMARFRELVLAHPGAWYFTAIGVLFALVLSALVVPVGVAPHIRHPLPWLIAAGLLALLPAADVAVALVHQIVNLLIPVTRLPRLDYDGAVPPGDRTAVVVPLLLGSVETVAGAIDHLEVQYLANRDPEVRFALLGDFLDAAAESTAGDDAIIEAALEGIRQLNATHGSPATDDAPADLPFYLLHRPRRWNASDAVWMGWERKRGKLVEFNAFIRGANDDTFARTEGDLGWLRGVRYVITLDADTVLPRGAAAALIGTMAHPLNRAEYDVELGRVTRGYGILQPRVSVSLASASESRFAAVYAGHPGVDPYTTAVSDVYQDLFGEGTFTGKGILDVSVFRQATDGRFPENTLLSHDLLEGTFARAGLVTDIEVFDDYPTRYLTATRRTHRWIRGDWQLLPWLTARVPGRVGANRNPLSALSRWKIADNMRRSLTPVALLVWFAASATILPGSWDAWAIAWLAALALPWLAPLAFALARPPRDQDWRPYYAAIARDGTRAFQQIGLAIVFLPDQALLAADAIARTLDRVFRSGRRRLEWQTASHTERTTSNSRSFVIVRMWPAVLAAAAILGLIAVRAPAAAAQGAAWWAAAGLWAAVVVAWLLAPDVALTLSAPLTRADLVLDDAQRDIALRYARRHWEYFDTFITADTHWLAPDNFQETPDPVIASRTSPTNIGLQLLATASACDLGFLAPSEMVERLERAFDSLDGMQRVRGHFFNWYRLDTLAVLDPPYVSTVDSGNLAGHLIAVAQACVSTAGGDDAATAARLHALARRARDMAAAMDFRLVYEPDRLLFSIGYNATSGARDEAVYDLLASESRLASFIAVSKNDVPVEHWFRLGRSLTVANGATALASWSGTMFEYLMPLIVMPSRPFSLLDQTCHAAVRRQVAYGRRRGVPWGISESAYNVRDRHFTYQYRAFGVPDLALKRNVGSDLVIAPYASVLALAVDAHEAMRNLAELERQGALGSYGFYDALDYTRAEPGERSAIVRTFMVHHIGMSLVALDNALSIGRGEPDGIWQRRFMADAGVRATALLLDERVPRRYVPVYTPSDQRADTVEATAPTRIAVHEVDTPHTQEPHVALLGGRGYSVLVTNAGSGYSRADNVDVFRWRADGTTEATGQWIYLKDVTSGATWSATYQPVRATPSLYHASFASDRVIFSRRDAGIETRTEVVVVTSEQAEVRRVTLVNHSANTRTIELTSYGEVVLCPADADRAHQAFQKLFVETEWLPAGALLASRRSRSSEESWPWCVHVVASGAECVGEVTGESDRRCFLGRGRTTHAPRAIDPGVALSGSVGAVLDPILSLRVRVRIEAGRSATVAFTTAVAPTREAAVQLADRYRDIESADRALSLARTEAEVELRDLDIAPSDIALYQELAGALIYPHEALRASPAERLAVHEGQQELWAQGISGDWPIVLATISAPAGLPSVRQLLTAHSYWRSKGIWSDLVILNAKPHSYAQELHDQLTTITMASGEGGVLERPGGVFIRRADLLSTRETALLRATARIHVIADGVGLGAIVAADIQKHTALMWTEPTPPAPSMGGVVARAPEPPTRAAAAASPHPNGFGSLTPNGHFAIGVAGEHVPPAPWANVIANPEMGFCVTERGGGFTWVENSHFFRLTPWFNDPVSDPCGEVLYLRDTESGAVWTPTPAPAEAAGTASASPAYAVIHGAGFTRFSHVRNGLATELTLAVPCSDPVKISHLRITNNGPAARHLALTSYVGWVLGAEQEHTRHQVHTRYDAATGAIFAQNYFAPDFNTRIAFSRLSEPVTSYTARRDHFLGRHGDLASPIGLLEPEMSGATGAGDDPCAALRCSLTLAPGESREVAVLLGAAHDAEAASALIGRYGDPRTAGAAIAQATEAWDERLSVIVAHTPDPAFDAMMNRWSLYQALSCRMWARSALYQSSGAYGFRDQLQDCMAFVYAEPGLARAHLLRAAGRQFLEGDVQHWWHEPSGRGVRTRFSDDLLWLPFVADHYVRVTGDTGVWAAPAPYLTMRALEPTEQEVYERPDESGQSGTLYDHCRRAIDRACTVGAHGLPLMGSGDWNDGMNRVGSGGKGESVWLAWFLIATLRRFAAHARARGDHAMAADCVTRADAYAAAANSSGWDGGWYRRAYFDDGAPLGSAGNDECQIDAIAQSWAVLSGAADPERARMAMAAVNERLVRDEPGLLLLLAPPFDHSPHDPGYIQGYVPGVRENGAQYTHAALWTVLAMAGLSDGDRAGALMRMLNPLLKSRTPAAVERYMVEPYVVAADVYSAPQHLGQGGWTWYTGSASWSYRVALEGILGFTKTGNRVRMNPCIPSDWPGFSVDYRFGGSSYAIRVVRSRDAAENAEGLVVDGVPVAGDSFPLVDDGREHEVHVTVRASDAMAPSSRAPFVAG